MDNTFIFKRYEIKYLIDEEQRALIQKDLDKYMTPDPHGKSTICNVYYDTPDYRLIRTSLEKPKYKEKIRMRSYGPVDSADQVFLELKKKYDGVVYKRRIELPEEEATAFMSSKDSQGDGSQIAREITYCKNFYKDLCPAVHLSYDRCAYFSKDDPNLRITFDQNIRWRNYDVSLTTQPGGRPLLRKGQYLMEVKTATALPLWLVKTITEGEMRKASFSKYGMAYMLEEKLMAKSWNFQPKEAPIVMPHKSLKAFVN